jgi:hypothetical protein
MSVNFCPQCGKQLTVVAQFCPSCGASLQSLQSLTQPQLPPQFLPPASPKKSHTLLIVGIVVIGVLVVGVIAGTYLWGRSAVNGMTITCESDSSTSGSSYVTANVEFGISNPSSLTISADWTIAISYPGGYSASSERTFSVPAGGIAYPTFSYSIDSSQASQVSGTPTVSLSQVENVLIYQYSSYQSVTGGASGSSSSSSLPSC